MENPALITSISPNIASFPDKSNHIRRVIQSFNDSGYDVVSLRRAHEPELSSDTFNVDQMLGSSRGFFANRYGPSFADVFSAYSRSPVGAIVNADTYLPRSNIVDFLQNANQTIIASRRIDVEYLGGSFHGIHVSGIDGLFSSPDIDLSIFENEQFALFQLGAPYWDMVIPLVLSFHFRLVFADLPILLHPSHDQVWRQADYQILRKHAAVITVQYAQKCMEQSPSARSFLRNLELYCPEYLTDESEKTTKKIALFIAFWLETIEKENAVTLDVNLNDPYVKGYVTSMASANREFINAAKRISDASQHRSLRQMGAIGRTVLKMRRVARRRKAIEVALEEAYPATSPLRRPRIKIKLRHDIWTAKQHKPRPLTKKTVAPDYARSSDLSVSIVTPSFNQAQYLGATISSVLAQSTPNLHYRVQDGGSSDGSVDLLRTFEGRINFDSIQDEGQSHALNLGFQETNGDVMAYLNSDDILLPDSIAIVLDFFRKNPEIDIVYSHRIFIDEKGLETGRAILPSHDGEALKWMDFVPQETMFWRRRVWDQIGPFDESLQFAMDWEFLLRASEANFRLARISTFLGAFRVHNQQKTSSWTEIGESEMMLLRERYLGFRPSRRQINNAVRPYLNRQAIYSSLARANLLRYQRANI